MMTVDERRRLYAKAYNQWGERSQAGMLIEECAELIKAINKWYRKKDHDNFINLIEELADVEIMTEQMRILWHVDEAVKSVKHAKLERLRETLSRIEDEQHDQEEDSSESS